MKDIPKNNKGYTDEKILFSPIKINKIYRPTKEKSLQYRLNHKLLSRETKQILVELKGNKCVICGNKFPNCCYDFHHRNPQEKDFQIKNIMSSYNNPKRRYLVMEELEKCDLLCSNCHRIQHFGDI